MYYIKEGSRYRKLTPTEFVLRALNLLSTRPVLSAAVMDVQMHLTIGSTTVPDYQDPAVMAAELDAQTGAQGTT